MPSSDPVGDMLAMIKDVKVVEDEKKKERKSLHLYLKYDTDGSSVISEIKRVSKPGCRIFRGVDSLGRIMDGLGVQVLSTSKGILSDRQARKERVGGELICKVW